MFTITANSTFNSFLLKMISNSAMFLIDKIIQQAYSQVIIYIYNNPVINV